jgi:hypothetical protein
MVRRTFVCSKLLALSVRHRTERRRALSYTEAFVAVLEYRGW